MRRNQLLQLLTENRRTFTPMAQRIQRVADGSEATVYLYDPIVSDRWMAEWFGGVCPQDFVPMVRAIDAERIFLRINCPGGDVFACEAMCEALRDHKATVEAHIEGLAASAATSIACACDRVLATPASKYMIHETWTWTGGTKRDHKRVMELLEKCDETMLEEYKRRTGQTLEQLRAWVEAETWFTADEAHNAGFVDEVKASAKASADARTWNLNAYARPPAPSQATPAPPPTPDNDPPAPPTVDDETRSRLAQRTRAAGLLLPIE